MSITMTTVRRALRESVSPRYLALAYAAYLLTEKTGLFRTLPATWREAFHSLPSRLFSLIFFLLAVEGMVTAIREAVGRERTGRVLNTCSILILIAGLWTSYFTRFEGKAIRAEGETFNAFPGDYVPESVFRARFAKDPEVGITVLNVIPATGSDVTKLVKVDAAILYAGRTTGRVLEGRLSSRWPLVSDWTMVGITDFGYMPTYILSDRGEKELESSKVYLKLYPAGAEEYFRTMFLGYLFYVRCYPDYFDDQGKPGTKTAVPKNPAVNLRIVRNKDIVYNGLVLPSEKVRFDNVVIAVPEVTMWIEISFVRDLGLPFVAAGFVMLIVSAGIFGFPPVPQRKRGY